MARALAVSRRFVMCRLAELGAIRCGRVYRISLEQLELWVERHRVQQDPVSMNEAATAAVRRALRGIREVA